MRSSTESRTVRREMCAAGESLLSPVLFRPHHGLCFCFFQGKGYSPEFTKNLRRILLGLSTNNLLICLTAGPDPVCAKCPNNLQGRCSSFEKVQRYDRTVLALCGLKEGDVLPYHSFCEHVRSCILNTGKRREVCADCSWDGLCVDEPPRFSQTV